MLKQPDEQIGLGGLRSTSTPLTVQIPEFNVSVHAARNYSIRITLVEILFPHNQCHMLVRVFASSGSVHVSMSLRGRVRTIERTSLQ